MATRFAVGSNVRIYAAERYNLSADTRLLPATRMPARPNTLFWFFVDGTATVHHDGTELNVQAPCLLAMPEHWSEGAEGRRAARIQTAGAPYASVQVHVRQPCDGLRRIPLSYAHAEEIRSMHRRAIDTDGDEGLRVLRALLLKLVSFRIIPCEALTASDERFYTEPAVARMWQALRRRYTALDASPSLKAMAAEANLSTRHAHRLMLWDVPPVIR